MTDQQRYSHTPGGKAVRLRYKKSEKGKDSKKKYHQSPNYHSSRLKYKYGITSEEYTTLLTEQDNKCGICRCPGGNGTKESPRLCIDHDHTTRQVRGLLCSTCNRAIGLFKDDPLVLRTAANYIEKERA